MKFCCYVICCTLFCIQSMNISRYRVVGVCNEYYVRRYTCTIRVALGVTIKCFTVHLVHETTHCLVKQARDFCMLVSERAMVCDHTHELDEWDSIYN